MVSAEQLQRNTSNYLRFSTSKQEEDIVYMTHPVYIKSLQPLKAYCLRYKFFQIGPVQDASRATSSSIRNQIKLKVFSEGDMVQALVQLDKRLEIGSKFNRKVSETVQDVLEGL